MSGVDLRGSKMTDQVNIAKRARELNDIKSVKHVFIVTKRRTLL